MTHQSPLQKLEEASLLWHFWLGWAANIGGFGLLFCSWIVLEAQMVENHVVLEGLSSFGLMQATLVGKYLKGKKYE